MRFGVDVGGTTVKLGVFEGKELKDSFSITTTKETLFDDIKDAIKAYTNNIEFKNDYEIYFPIDYLHLLNCICIYRIEYSKGCYNKDSYIEIPATKLTSDSLGLVL